MTISTSPPASWPDPNQVLHFILAVDGSEPSLRAAHWLAGFSQTQAALRCTVLYVKAPLLAGEISALAPAEISLGIREQEAASTLEQVSAIFQSVGLAHTPITCTGDAADHVLSYAEKLGADAIVLGRRNQSALRAALLGSVSSQIVRRSLSPVILVGESTPLASNPSKRRLRLLLALDRFPNALRAADFAAKLAKQSGGQVHALHVQPTLSLAEALFSPRQHLLDHWAGQESQESLQPSRDLLKSRGIEVEEHAASSDTPDAAICQLALKLGCDLVVMGTRGLNPMSAAIMGSVTQGVLAQASPAVALVK